MTTVFMIFFTIHLWRSFIDLWISPLHTKFHSPLSHSSELVSRAFRQFSATLTFNPIHRHSKLIHFALFTSQK
uniref:Secreted protein n=1 Tax=Populus trichocarpa TaxID=3694 RepID=A0A2K1R4P4_POPTR